MTLLFLLLMLTFNLIGRKGQGKLRTFLGEKTLKDFHTVLWGPLSYLPFSCQVLLSLLKMSPNLCFTCDCLLTVNSPDQFV